MDFDSITDQSSLTAEWRKTEGPLYSKRELKAFERYMRQIGFEHVSDDEVLGFRSYMRQNDGSNIMVYLDSLGEEGIAHSGVVIIAMNGQAKLTSIWDLLKETRLRRIGLDFQDAGTAVQNAAKSTVDTAGSCAKTLYRSVLGRKNTPS